MLGIEIVSGGARRSYVRAVLGTLVLGAALLGAAPAGATAFSASVVSLGAIPDGMSTCGTFGASRDITFTVSGLPNLITDVEVAFTLNPAHTFVGDLDVVLIAPDGVTQHTIFSRTGSISAVGCGDTSDVAGPYTFSDGAQAPPNGGWWEAATATASTVAIPTGIYRATLPGGVVGSANPSPATTITPTFAGFVSPNGVWTLRFRDAFGPGDTGSVFAATLDIDAVDTIKPNTTITKHPKKSTLERRATFRFRSSEAGTFQCRLDAKAWKPCSSPKTMAVTRGSHTLRVRAKDTAGNVDPTPAVFSWRVRRP